MDKAMHSEFEGHTPGPWEYCEGDFDGPPIVAKFINERQDKIRISECDFAHIRQAMAILSARGEGGNEFPIEDTQAFSRDTERANAKLIAAAPDLLKENQSLRSELQKQKELNAELVKDKEFLKDMICKVLSIDILTDEAKASVLRQANRALEDDAILRYTDMEIESLIKKYKES